MAYMPVILKADIQGIAGYKQIVRGWKGMQKESLKEVADYWFEEYFPRHFESFAPQKYRYDRRNKGYLKETKVEEGVGIGKTNLLILRGASRRMMIATRSVRGTSRQMTLTLGTPPYFTRPNMGVTYLPNGRRVVIKRQPDKVRELTTIHSSERNVLTAVFETRFMARLLIAMQKKLAEKTKGNP